MTDIDVDQFLFGRQIDLTEEAATPAELAAVADPHALVRERVLARQTTLEGREEPVVEQAPKSAATYVTAVVLRSRSGSDRPHVVTILTFPDGTRATACTCEAMLSVARRPEGCWAMVYVRGLVGIAQPGGPA